MSSEKSLVGYKAPEVGIDDVVTYIDCRRWQSPEIIVGSSLVHTPFARELLPASPDSIWQYYENLGQATERPAGKAGEVLTDITSHPFSYLRPTFLAALPADHFLKREGVVVSESIVASETAQNEGLLSLMARFPSYLPTMRRIYGPDASTFRYAHSSSVKRRLAYTVDARLLAHDLIQSGALLPERVEQDWPEIAKTLLVKVWKESSHHSSEIGLLPVVLALNQYDMREIDIESRSSHDPPVFYPFQRDAVSAGRGLPPDRGGFSPMPTIKQLAQEAELLMKKAGWVKPEGYFNIPLMILEEAASRGKDPLEEWRLIEKETWPIIGQKFPGSFIRAAEQLIFHVATETAFRTELATCGIPTSFVGKSADQTVMIKEGCPENLLVQLAEVRKARSASIMGCLGSMMYRPRPDEQSFIEKATREIDRYLDGFAAYTKDINWQALLGFMPDSVQSAYSALLTCVRSELSEIGYGPVSEERSARINDITLLWIV